MIYEDFNKDHSLKISCLLFDVLRNLLLAFTVIALQSCPLLLVTLLNLINWVFLVYVLVKRPINQKLQFFFVLVCEIFLNLLFFCCEILAIMDYTNDQDLDLRMNIGWYLMKTIYMAINYTLYIDIYLYICQGNCVHEFNCVLPGTLHIWLSNSVILL